MAEEKIFLSPERRLNGLSHCLKMMMPNMAFVLAAIN
jgi:hypothetical protein